jgi:hypothetical protein
MKYRVHKGTSPAALFVWKSVIFVRSPELLLDYPHGTDYNVSGVLAPGARIISADLEEQEQNEKEGE